MAVNLAIFASGRGSNAKKIIEYFQNHSEVSVQLIVANRSNAKVLDLGSNYGIATQVLRRDPFYSSTTFLQDLEKGNIDYLILAGFLWLVPAYLVQAYPNRILNIHPALLPKYGGKGMYGMNVHQAVADAKESESGITIHYVNEHYDEGAIVFQASCAIEATDTAEQIAQKVLSLEHTYYPQIIEQVIQKDIKERTPDSISSSGV